MPARNAPRLPMPSCCDLEHVCKPDVRTIFVTRSMFCIELPLWCARRKQHPCGPDGGVPVSGITKPGDPRNPGVPQSDGCGRKFTGALNTGLPLAMAAFQQ